MTHFTLLSVRMIGQSHYYLSIGLRNPTRNPMLIFGRWRCLHQPLVFAFVKHHHNSASTKIGRVALRFAAKCVSNITKSTTIDRARRRIVVARVAARIGASCKGVAWLWACRTRSPVSTICQQKSARCLQRLQTSTRSAGSQTTHGNAALAFLDLRCRHARSRASIPILELLTTLLGRHRPLALK